MLDKTPDGIEGLQSVARLSRDMRIAAETLSDQEARYLVDTYYTVQDYRKAADNQVRALGTAGEPSLFIGYVAEQHRVIENQIKGALDRYTSGHALGEWPRSVPGIGPVITAGLIAHIDMDRAPTVGHIWNFAGLNPGIEWGKGQKRPFNADLKTLCWKIGQSFMKMSSNPNDYYGHLYKERKAIEVEKNEAGEFADQAREKLEKFKIGKTTDAFKWYSGEHALKDGGELRPMLPPAHIDARARRWVVKLFLSHLHSVWHEIEFGKPAPEPYALAHTGHAHLIKPPTFPLKP